MPTSMDRRGYIGGTDIAAICGWNPYKSALDVYYETTRPPGEEELNRHLVRGRELEANALEAFRKKETVKLAQVDPISHPEHEFVRANVDGLILPSENDGHPSTLAVLEAKAPADRSFKRVIEAGPYDSWIAQLHWYMGIYDAFCREKPAPFTGYEGPVEHGAFSIYNVTADVGPLDGCISVWRELDRELFDAMLERAIVFWHAHVEPSVPPDPDEFRLKEQVNQLETTEGMAVVDEDEELEELIQRKMERAELEREAKELHKEAKADLEEYLVGMDVKTVKVPGVAKIVRVQNEGRTTFDRELLEKACPMDADALRRKLRSWASNHEAADEILEEVLEECKLDLSRFEKKGSPYSYVRVYSEGDDG